MELAASPRSTRAHERKASMAVPTSMRATVRREPGRAQRCRCRMPSISLALLFAAASGPLADPPSAPVPVCPTGDTPTGEIGQLVHVSRLRALDVVGGHGVVTFEDVIENRTASAAMLSLSLGDGGVIRAASVEEPGFAARPAHLDDATAASAEFQSYYEALVGGVGAEEVVNSAERAAILVTDTDDDGVPRLEVLVPCSVRSVTV